MNQTNEFPIHGQNHASTIHLDFYIYWTDFLVCLYWIKHKFMCPIQENSAKKIFHLLLIFFLHIQRGLCIPKMSSSCAAFWSNSRTCSSFPPPPPDVSAASSSCSSSSRIFAREACGGGSVGDVTPSSSKWRANDSSESLSPASSFSWKGSGSAVRRPQPRQGSPAGDLSALPVDRRDRRRPPEWDRMAARRPRKAAFSSLVFPPVPSQNGTAYTKPWTVLVCRQWEFLMTYFPHNFSMMRRFPAR